MMPTRDQELAVLRSVIYASLFDYPLTPAQLEVGLIGVRADAATIERWWRESGLLRAAIDYRDGHYFPAGRSDLHRVLLLLQTPARDVELMRTLIAGVAVAVVPVPVPVVMEAIAVEDALRRGTEPQIVIDL